MNRTIITRTSIAFAGLTAFVAFAPSLAKAAPPKEESAMAVAVKEAKRYDSAMKSGDLSYFEKGATSDFVMIDAKGQKATKAQTMEGVKATLQVMKIKTMTSKVVSAKKAEGGVLYVISTKMSGTMNIGQKKPAVMKSDMTDEILTVNQGGKWMTKRVKSLKDNTTLDGKPMKM